MWDTKERAASPTLYFLLRLWARVTFPGLRRPQPHPTVGQADTKPQPASSQLSRRKPPGQGWTTTRVPQQSEALPLPLQRPTAAPLPSRLPCIPSLPATGDSAAIGRSGPMAPSTGHPAGFPSTTRPGPTPRLDDPTSGPLHFLFSLPGSSSFGRWPGWVLLVTQVSAQCHPLGEGIH